MTTPTDALYRDDAYLKSTEASVVAVTETGVILDRTVFYPGGGGQAADTGTLTLPDGQTLVVTGIAKGELPPTSTVVPVHILAVGGTMPALGTAVTATIDWDRRYRLMRIHTALHVLSCVVVAPVTGGNIAPDKGRLDFDIDMSLLDGAKIEREANAIIARHLLTETVWITDAAGARYLARAGAHKVHEGDWAPRRIVILEFPSIAAWEAFYTGPVYQGLKSIRDACSSARLVSVEGLTQ